MANFDLPSQYRTGIVDQQEPRAPEQQEPRTVVDELLYSVGQMGAGIIEYMGASPEASQELPGIGHITPNFIWSLAGLSQQIASQMVGETPTEPTTAQRYAQAGVMNANDMMSEATGQEIGNPKNLVDTLLREIGLFMIPTGALFNSAKYAGKMSEVAKGVGAVLAPGAQARTGGGLLAEYAAGVGLADSVEEYFDTEDDPYLGTRDILSREEYPVQPKPISGPELLKQAYPNAVPKTGPEMLAEAYPTNRSLILDGELQETDDKPWLINNYALSIAGVLATVVGGTAAARHFGKARQAYIRANSRLFKDPDFAKQMSIRPKERNLGTVEATGVRDPVRESNSIIESVRAAGNTFRSTVHDYNRMLHADNDWALKHNKITELDHAENLRMIRSVGNDGAIGLMSQSTARSGIFPMSSIASRRPIAGILDRVALLRPKNEIMLNEHLVFRRVLHEMNEYNKLRAAQGKPKIDSWGLPNGRPDGDGWFSEAYMKRIVNTPLPKSVRRLVEDYDDVMRKTAEWGKEQGFIDEATYKAWQERPYAPLRYAGQDPHATDFLRSQQEIFDNRVMPEAVMKPTDLLGEYLNSVMVRVLHNRLRRDMLQLELKGGRKMIDGSPAVRIIDPHRASKADLDRAVTVYAHNPILDPKTGKKHSGTVHIVVEEANRRSILRRTPMQHLDFVNKLDAFRRFSQSATTGQLSVLTSKFFAPISAAFEAVTSTINAPRGYSTGQGGRIARALTGDPNAQWDAFVDPTALANPVVGTVQSMYSDLLRFTTRRLRTALDMSDDLSDYTGNIVGQTLPERAAGKLTRPIDRGFVKAFDSMYGRNNTEALYQIMERAYLNSMKRWKESLGGGTAPIFGEHMNDVPRMMHEIAPTWSRNTGEFHVFNNPVFQIWESVNDGLHGSTRVAFMNSNKSVALHKARINGTEIPIMSKPGVIGYSPQMHDLVMETRRLTGDVMQRGGVPGTATGRVFDAVNRTTPYMNVAIQVLGRLMEQFRERPVYVTGALASYAAATQAYIATHILGNPERERQFAKEMGPSQRAYSWYLFNDDDEIVFGYAMPHELRVFISPIIEAMLAANGLTAQTGNDASLGSDMMKNAWRRFYQDVVPNPVPQPVGMMFGGVLGQHAPDINFGRFRVGNSYPPENFEGDDEEFMNRVRLLSDEAFLGASTMFMSTMEALHAAAYRDSHDIDWPRLTSDLQTALTMPMREERGAIGKVISMFDEDFVTNPRTISTYDDPAKIEWKNSIDKMQNWTKRIEERVLSPGVFGGVSGYSDPQQAIRDIYERPLQLGLPDDEDIKIGMWLKLLLREDPVIQQIMKDLETLDDREQTARKENSDPIQRRKVLNVIAMQEKERYARGVMYLRHLEKMIREIAGTDADGNPRFTKFQDLPNWPDSPWFEEEGVGKRDPARGDPTAVQQYERDPIEPPAFLSPSTR